MTMVLRYNRVVATAVLDDVVCLEYPVLRLVSVSLNRADGTSLFACLPTQTGQEELRSQDTKQKVSLS
jgi:hypothetical protein